MSPSDVVKALADEPILTVKHGRIYWSAAIVAVLASGLASYFVTRAQVEDLAKRADLHV